MTKAAELAARFDGSRPFAFIYTDIERDGMMKGPNIGATREFAQSVTSLRSFCPAECQV